jgi:integrase
MREVTGVKKDGMKDLRPPERTFSEEIGKSCGKVPSQEDVGRIVSYLSDPKCVIKERDRLAALLTVYTVQRRHGVALARKDQFESAGELGGLWKLPPIQRKTASSKARRGIDVGSHVIPLPPAAWSIVLQAVALSQTDYLFPSFRARRQGQESNHLDASTITQTFALIPGNEFSPHDMRRGFGTTYGREAKLKLDEIKTILDHNEGVQSGDVTATHYAFLDGTHAKWLLMKGWCDWIGESRRFSGI